MTSLSDSDAASQELAAWLLPLADKPAAVTSIGLLLLAALCLSVLAPALRPVRSPRFEALVRFASGDGFFVGGAIALILFCRAPTLCVSWPLNPDEGQMLAQAMRFVSVSAVPWLGVDTTTSGPLNSYALAGPMILGMSPSWALARVVALGCWIMAIVFSYGALRYWVRPLAARIAFLPAVVFVAAAVMYDFVHYSSELVSIVLLSTALFLGAKSLSANEARPSYAGAGVALGSVPFAKLQAVPIALAMGGLLLLAILGKRAAFAERFHSALRLCGGALVVPVLILGWVALEGGLPDFWAFYIENNLNQNGGVSSASDLLRLAGSGGFQPFALSVLALALLGLGLGWRRRWNAEVATRLFGAAAIALCALFAVAVPGRSYPHYLALLVMPLTWLSALALGTAQWPKGPWLAVALAAAPLAARLWLGPDSLTMHDQVERWIQPTKAEPVTILRHLANTDDRLSIWGWMPQYYVESGLVPATRHAICLFVIERGGRYRETFAEDLENEKPLFLLEAIGPGNFHFDNRQTEGIQTAHEIWESVGRAYTKLVDRESYALYVRNHGVVRIELGNALFDLKGGWAQGVESMHAGAHGAPGEPSEVYGSWVGSDANTGVLRIRPSQKPPPHFWMEIPVLVSPDVSASRITLRDDARGTEFDGCDLRSFPVGTWQLCLLAGKADDSTELILEVRDDGADWGQWLAIGTPSLLMRTDAN